MTEQEVINLMSSSKSQAEWNNNCDTVKQNCGGYPEFWFSAIILGGVLESTKSNYGW